MKYKEYITVDGDTASNIAQKEYGNSLLVNWILNANPDAFISHPLPGGIKLDIPVLEDLRLAGEIPFWKVDGAAPDPELPDETIGAPVRPPINIPLDFYGGYPRVVGNKLEFAITRNDTLPYVVEKSDGSILVSSPGWVFNAAFAVSTPEIADGGLYRVKVGNITSPYFPILGAKNPLRFQKVPSFSMVGENRIIRYTPDFGGTYQVTLKRANGNPVYPTETKTLVAGREESYLAPNDGDFEVVIGPISAMVSVFASQNFLEAIGMTNDTNSHDVSIWVRTLFEYLTDMKVVAVDNSNFNGLTEPAGPFKQDQWIPGTTNYAGPNYDQVFRLNAASPGQGGLIPGKQYKLSFRKKGTTEPIFEKTVTIPNVSNVNTPVDIPLIDGGTGNACERGPFIGAMHPSTAKRIVFDMDGRGIKAAKTHIKNVASDEVVQTVDVDFVRLVNGVEVASFDPSWRAVINLTIALPAATYRIGIEGISCDSPIHWADATFTVADTIPVPEPEPDPEDEIELALYFSTQGGAAMKARVLGTAPFEVKAYNENNDEIHSQNTSSNEAEIPDSVVSALGNQRIKVTAKDATGKTSTRFMSKIVRDRERIMHAFISISNGDTKNHLAAIRLGDAIPGDPVLRMTATAVIFGELENDGQYEQMKNTSYNGSGQSTFLFDNVVNAASKAVFAKRLKIGIHLAKASYRLKEGNQFQFAYSYNALVMRPGGTQPTTMPWIAAEMVPSPAHPETRAYAVNLFLAFVGRYKEYILNGVIPWLGPIFGSSGEAEYPTGYKNSEGRDETYPDGYPIRAKGDYNPVNVALFKSRYPQHATRSDGEIYNSSFGSQLDLDWREHHAVVMAEFHEYVWGEVYKVHPELIDCQIEMIDVGSALDDLSPFRMSQNLRRRVRKTTGMVKMNDNPHGGNRMRFIGDVASSFVGLTVAFEPSPTDANFGKQTVRNQVADEVTDVMIPRDISWSFFDATPDNVRYLLLNTGFVPGMARIGKQMYKLVNGVKKLFRLERKVSDIFKFGAFNGWENAWLAFKNEHGLAHVDTVSVDDLYIGQNPGPEPEQPGENPGGPDPGNQAGNYLVKYVTEPYPGEMKLQLTPTATGMKVTDLVTSTPRNGARVVYCINEKVYNLPRLIDFEWDFPGPLSIRKGKFDNSITELYMTGGGQAGEPVVGIDPFENGTSYAQADLIAIKQNS